MTQWFGNDIRNGTDKLKFDINNIDSVPIPYYILYYNEVLQ